MAKQAPSTGRRAGASPQDPNFNPNYWLDEWLNSGGAVIISRDRPTVGGVLDRRYSDEQRSLWSQLDAKPGRRDIVADAIADRWWKQ